MKILNFLPIAILCVLEAGASANIVKTQADRIYMVDSAVAREIPMTPEGAGFTPDCCQLDEMVKIFEKHIAVKR